ncbi:rab5 GDP/GTP exchange factor [Scaptodrosophila lebanonensis]|uniref:Rab5 GDP/GTP exchange factor n=1 Tax=Drosophila lebanonensis TaxID=7225 RepID=A0A6J2TIR0_DROLE|nr:rab5 GDP/GTP exchange factor [Scaptodrosophila lebanonensis]
MYSTGRAPQLRIGTQDLKCKRGCGFYGNAQFDGLCSKCFRERNDERKRQKASASSSSLVLTSTGGTMERISPQNLLGRPHQKNKQERDKQQPQGSSDVAQTLQKKKSIVPTVLQKTLQVGAQKLTPQKHYVPDPTENQFMLQLRQLGIPDDGKRKLKKEIQRLDLEIKRYMNSTANSNNKNIDELSEMVQNAYTRFADLVHSDPSFQIVSNEDRDSAIDFFEKVVMTQNHKFLFSPYFTADEENDAKVQKRIRQLSWITAKHLDCSIDEVNAESRDLVYNAISELVGIDSYYSPQEKLECTVRCCRHIFELLKRATGGPASADDFLPALIFVVLKANPVRLHSNLNFVTRFTNAARVMSGEGGYYFTNLCSAIAFIENLNGESLNISCEEFDALMSGEKPYSTPWESALLACESLHLISENMKRMELLKKRNMVITTGISEFERELIEFQSEVTRKVDTVYAKAPLTLLPIKTPAFLISQARAQLNHSSDDAAALISSGHYQSNLLNAIDVKDVSCTDKAKSQPTLLAPDERYADAAHTLALKDVSISSAGHLSPLHTTLPQPDQLFASPIFNYGPFDAVSLLEESSDNTDVLMLGTEFQGGLTNINYDFDLSDKSGENSVADDSNVNLDEFDPLAQQQEQLRTLKVEAQSAMTSGILDSTTDSSASLIDSDLPPPTGILLPSPLKPEVSNYRGFSNFDIPSISCNTGDFSSLGQDVNESTSSDVGVVAKK